MSNKIEVEEAGIPERPGERVAIAMVGPGPRLLTMFEIRVRTTGRGKSSKQFADYYVDAQQVTREIYFDALSTVERDRFCEDCVPDDSEEDDGEAGVVCAS